LLRTLVLLGGLGAIVVVVIVVAALQRAKREDAEP